MAWISAIPIVGELLGKIVDRIPDPNARAQAVEAIRSAELAGDLEVIRGQLEINKIEAASPSFWVAGARPAMMWLCAAGLGYQFVLYPFLVWGSKLADIPYPPEVDASLMLSLVMSMLGLGTMRSYEKTKGIASNQTPLSRAAALSKPSKQ